MHCAHHHASRPPHAFRLPPSALPMSPLPPTTPCALCGSHVPTSSQHRCQHHTARPHVHRLGPELGAMQQLRGHVGQGAAHLVQQALAAVMLEDSGQAKIGDFQVVWAKRKNWLKADKQGAPGCPSRTSFVQEQVLWLQVPVGDAHAVQVDLGKGSRVRRGGDVAAAAATATLTTPAISCWKKRCASGSGIPISGSAGKQHHGDWNCNSQLHKGQVF